MSLPKKHVGVFYKCPVGSTDVTIEYWAVKARKIARDLQDFMRYHSDGKWDVQCQGFGMASDCDPRPPYMCSLDAKKVDTGDFVPNYWHTVTNTQAGFCGQARFQGDISVNYYFGQCGQATTDHELGHNLGLMHDGTRDADGTEKEYGHTSIMGSGGGRREQGMASPHRVLLGFESDREILRVDTTQQVLIAPTEMSKHVLHVNEWQNIQVGRDHWLSLRKQRGTRYPVYKGKEEELYIHEVDSRDRGNMKLLLPTLKPTFSHTLPTGVMITYEEYNQETARVTIQYPEAFGDNEFGLVPWQGENDLEMPSGPPATLQSSRITEGHSGLWYKPEYDGQGYDIMVVGDRVVLYEYTFDEAGVQQRFYLGNGVIEDGASVFDYYTTKGGTFENPIEREVIKTGKAQLFFNDDTTGVFHWNTEEHGRGAVNLTLLAKMIPSDFNGSWYNPDRDGEGFTIKMLDNPNGPMLVVYWFTYDMDGNQKWYSFSGHDTNNLTMYESLGGRWMFYDDVEHTAIGTGRVFMNRGGGLTVQYDSTTLGKGQRPVVKLFGVTE